ncbi:hypothetical protein RFI_40200, partial [Reticulomyxa filosa]
KGPLGEPVEELKHLKDEISKLRSTLESQQHSTRKNLAKIGKRMKTESQMKTPDSRNDKVWNGNGNDDNISNGDEDLLTVQSEIEKLKNERNGLEVGNEELKRQVQQLQAELENAKLVSGKKEAIEQLRVKNESLCELNQQLTNECNDIHDRTSQLQQQLQQ